MTSDKQLYEIGGHYERWVVKNDATNDYLTCQPAMYEGLAQITSCHLFDAIQYENLEDAESMLRHVEKTVGGVWFIRRDASAQHCGLK